MAEAQAKTEQQVAYLSVTGEDLAKILPAIKEVLGWDIPYPKMSSAEIAIADGRIIGVSIVHLQPTIGPMWVAPNYRGTGVAEHIADRTKATADGAGFKQCVVQTQSEYVKKLCKDRGMVEKGEYTVLVTS